MNNIGKWIAIDEDGIWCSPFTDSYFFTTKKAIIKDISDAELDARKTPKIIRESEGVYIYKPKSCDTNTFSKEYTIIRLTKENVEKYEEQISEQERSLYADLWY